MPAFAPVPPLGGLTPAAFLRRHWQKRALLLAACRSRIPRLPVHSGTVRAVRSRRCRIAHRDARAGALVDGARTVPTLRFQQSPRARLDAAGARRKPALRRRRGAAAALRIHPLRAAGRSDGELRRAGRRRRRALRFLRRVSASRRRPATLAHQHAARPRAQGRPAAQDPRALPARRAMDARIRATCSTSRPITRTKVSPSMRARRIRSVFARHRRRTWAPLFSTGCATGSRCRGATLTRISLPRASPLASTLRCRRNAARCCSAIRWDERAVASFLGCHLTEPKPHVFFDTPPRALSLRRFAATAMRRGAALGPTNSNPIRCPQSIYQRCIAWCGRRGAATRLKRLANARHLDGDDVGDAAAVSILHRWYHDGYIDFD